ncbi:dUTP diphosphatase [Alkalibacillus almallahensis]|uniref:dUTP diphosphatase n=1 Tax=Alkalibacillus almallahensis TaxID=1379154 RepID=UPI00141E9A9B|nr:dUTP diphosphatase [Alkalibacillus almallahensis]NIK10903.1 dimeric dUTPase (all-alpha-NTP-PPase superfamily) [Alkalibacillus almallahensis]
MNLIKLFEAQRELDQHIIYSKPHLKEEDVLPRKILALQVELGELANEWRGFKFWSEDQDPRRVKRSIAFSDPGGPFEQFTYPLLEEYVDCLHFLISIGIELAVNEKQINREAILARDISITNQFLYLNKAVSGLYWNATQEYANNAQNVWEKVYRNFLLLGSYLEFNSEQVEQAYFDKNQVNHDRQESGY